MTPSVGACSRVNVTADGGLIYADEKCVDILPPANAPPKVGGVAPPPATSASKLEVTMRATANPARVGQPMGLFVYVKNNGTQPERGVSLRLLVPQEMTPDAAQIRPLGTAQVVGKEVNFGNIGDLQPGDEREFELVLSVGPPRQRQFSGGRERNRHDDSRRFRFESDPDRSGSSIDRALRVLLIRMRMVFMLRFVLLLHDCPHDKPRPTHCDLMFEAGDSLATWALATLPSDWQASLDDPQLKFAIKQRRRSPSACPIIAWRISTTKAP